MPKRLTCAMLIALMSFAVSCLMQTAAIAHDHHGDGHEGGHEGDFGDDGRSLGDGLDRGIESGDDHIRYQDGDLHRTHRIRHRYHDGDGFLDNFDDEDECYPEWFYNRGDLPFRSDVCPD